MGHLDVLAVHHFEQRDLVAQAVLAIPPHGVVQDPKVRVVKGPVDLVVVGELFMSLSVFFNIGDFRGLLLVGEVFVFVDAFGGAGGALGHGFFEFGLLFGVPFGVVGDF